MCITMDGYSYITSIMNNLVTQLTYGVKRFKNFRKHLVHDYKWGGKHDHRNTHAIPLELK